MRRLFWQMMVSLDGLMEGPNHELGAGAPMFKHIKERFSLKLVKTQTWRSGVVVLYYQPT